MYTICINDRTRILASVTIAFSARPFGPRCAYNRSRMLTTLAVYKKCWQLFMRLKWYIFSLLWCKGVVAKGEKFPMIERKYSHPISYLAVIENACQPRSSFGTLLKRDRMAQKCDWNIVQPTKRPSRLVFRT